jgi:hypothetical protein
MSGPGGTRPWGELARDLDEAHAKATGAAAAGLADAALGPLRLSGPGVDELAEAAVSSATPFLRAPLLARMHAVGRLHPDADGTCPSCGVPAPCPTALALFGGS